MGAWRRGLGPLRQEKARGDSGAEQGGAQEDKAAAQHCTRDSAHFGPLPLVSSRVVSAVTYTGQESFDLSSAMRKLCSELAWSCILGTD